MTRAKFVTILPILLSGMGGFGEAPKTWDAKSLADWATPVAGLNVRPGYFRKRNIYRAPVDNVRTYPVCYPGREPEGYWEMLQKIGPKPLIEPDTLKADVDWIRAGKHVFEEYDIPVFRTYDPQSTRQCATPKPSPQSLCDPARMGRCPHRHRPLDAEILASIRVLLAIPDRIYSAVSFHSEDSRFEGSQLT